MVQSGPQEDAQAREAAAAAALEESSAEVRAAGVALARVAAELPEAQRSLSTARGRLVGAQAKARSAETRAVQAEAAASAAQAEVDVASAQVDQGRREVGLLGRRAYMQDRWSGLRAVAEADRPQDALERAQMLRSILQFSDRQLTRLTDERLSLATRTADLAALRRAAQTAQADAVGAAQQAEEHVISAAAAAKRVASLVQQRKAALTSAESLRAQDQREYQAAQAASRALAERIRAAAARQAAAQRAAERLAAERERVAAEASEQRDGRRAAEPRSTPPRNGRMLWPSDGPLTSRYGYRRHPIYGDRRLHAGIDIGSGSGAGIIAAAAGTVLLSYYSASYGNLTVIDHGVINGRQITTAYAHQSQRVVAEGQRVAAGELIGRVGSTGNSTGPHLHFEVREEGEPVDPLKYVDEP